MRHDVVVHHETAADVDDDGLANREAMFLVGTDRLDVVLVDVENEDGRPGVAREVGDAPHQPPADAHPLQRLHHVELVELGRGAIGGDVPRREPCESAIDARELEPAVIRVEEPFEHR